ncbi:MAG TPA: oligosaccharide flippase family protein [Candidatus Gallacutalibacter stercoravium]|nr:oligosaccharide flippase family protein [Candidatus Gallacutalibacter stercoravium]
MQKRTFMFNTLLLTCATLLSRTIGISFRVFMSNQIGAEGVGLYQLVTTVYFFATTFATAGISLTVTRLVTDALAEKQPGRARTVIFYCLLLSLLLSIAAGLALFFGAGYIGGVLVGDARTVLPLQILAPSLPFMAVSACLRGYFYGVRKVLKTASEQLLEQGIEIAVFACLIGSLAPKGLEYACCAIVLGTTLAEIVSCAYSFLLYWQDSRALRRSAQHSREKGVIKKILSVSLPVTASSCLRSGLSTVENMMIPRGLKKSGASAEASLAGYGMLTGMVMPVITFPSAFLSSFSMLLIPELSEANAVHHKRNIRYIAGRSFQITLLFSILVMGVLLLFADQIGQLIYHDSQPGGYIRLLAPVIPLMYLDSVADGMLKGLNEQLRYLSYNLIDSFTRVILILCLLPLLGIYGLIVVIFTSELLNSTLSIARLLKVTGLRLKVGDWILKPLLAVSAPGLLAMWIVRTEPAWFSSPLPLIALVACICLCYFTSLFLMGSISREDIRWAKNILIKTK